VAKLTNSGAAAAQGQDPLSAGGRTAAMTIGKHIPIVHVEPVHVFYTVGCWALAITMMAPHANDWMLHLVQGKAYFYYLGYPLALVAFLFCGSALRGLQTTVGKLWLIFSVWLVLDIPFSVWRSGSLELVRNYLSRDVLWFFVISGLAINLRYVKFLLHAAIFSAFMVVGTCAFFGTDIDGRFRIPESSFFASANELAITLVINMGLFSFLLTKKWRWKILGGAGIVLSGFYMLRTGSRGGFVAALLLLAISFIGAKNKVNAILVVAPLLLTIPLVKRETLMRLALIYIKPEKVEVVSDKDESSIASQISRQYLLRRSVEVSFRHPLFGVGPGQFIEATSGADQKRGKHSPALGTHNTYTQVSSECGVIPFICFVGALVIPIRRMRHLYKHVQTLPELGEVPQMAYAILLCLAGYGGAMLFHHVAYSGHLPLFSALAVSLWLAVEGVIAKQPRETVVAPVMAGNRKRPWVRSNGA
jgi:O-antigen ligase